MGKSKMYLRDLKMKDASFMLEWMHDESVVENLQADFVSKTITDCEDFIANCKVDVENKHMAIADENDEYMGTVSLKNIDYDMKSAEFAITIRAGAMGKGYSKYAMCEIIRIAFEELRLNNVYWCVDPKNKRAVKFYDKNNWKRVSYEQLFFLKKQSNYTKEQIDKYFWYLVVSK